MMFSRQIPYLNAGLISLLVGYSSSAIIVVAAAKAAGASESDIASWLGALGVGIGILSFGLSWWLKKPIVIAWSTPGAALLVGSVQGFTLNETIGAFLVAAILTMIVGFSGLFGRLIKLIPQSLAAAMLAGILFHFGLTLFSTLEEAFNLVILMLVAYFSINLLNAKFGVAAALLVGVIYCQINGLFNGSLDGFTGLSAITQPVWTMPEFSMAAVFGISLPLFIVTMASQNIPGAAIMKANNYQVNDSAIVGLTGLTTFLLAPLGGFCLNLGAIMAAICVGEEAEPDPNKRYMSAMWCGFFYFISGIFAASIVGLMLLFPQALVSAIAGLALLGTIGSSLSVAMADENNRTANLVTLLMAASGVSLWQISGAFWGLLLGLIISYSHHIFQRKSSIKIQCSK